MKMNKQDFTIKAAKLAGWHIVGIQIVTPDRFLYSVKEISSGFLVGIESDMWNRCHKHLLFDQAIEAINKKFRDGESKLYVSSNSDGYVLFDEDRNSFGVGYIENDDTYSAKEKVLQKYFSEVMK